MNIVCGIDFLGSFIKHRFLEGSEGGAKYSKMTFLTKLYGLLVRMILLSSSRQKSRHNLCVHFRWNSGGVSRNCWVIEVLFVLQKKKITRLVKSTD